MFMSSSLSSKYVLNNWIRTSVLPNCNVSINILQLLFPPSTHTASQCFLQAQTSLLLNQTKIFSLRCGSENWNRICQRRPHARFSSHPKQGFYNNLQKFWDSQRYEWKLSHPPLFFLGGSFREKIILLVCGVLLRSTMKICYVCNLFVCFTQVIDRMFL